MASRPAASVFVAANAGSGKTSTLVKRVARLLLDGARPEAILCVTYTKAGAAEMQRRLFQDLGAWAVMEDAPLRRALAAIDEGDRPLSQARALFARALEPPGGLKIQTLHAFCEKLLRRFPLEAGVSPGFEVLEDAAAAEVSARARDRVAQRAVADPDGAVARAYAHFSVELDWASFNAMFDAFEARRAPIAAHVAACESRGYYLAETWRACGFAAASSCAAVEAETIAAMRFRWNDWARAAEALSRSTKTTDQALGAAMTTARAAATFEAVCGVFFTRDGSPRQRLGTKEIDGRTRDWLTDEQARHEVARERRRAARIAEDTVHALTLAITYAAFYEDEKAGRGVLDFSDLIARVHTLLSERADAAWVLYKLDGGLEHILLDEAQDTAPEQWDILRALTEEFFSGLGAAPVGRTVFAVGDEKQSIFSFQGAAPERLAVETQVFETMAVGAGMDFLSVKLLESWRSAPEVLAFVDVTCLAPEMLAGLRPARGGNVLGFPITHQARRPPAGCVELWPLERSLPGEAPDVWAPVDAEPPTSAVKLLATRISAAIGAMVARGDAVHDKETGAMRPCVFGDVLILVRRRSTLFHEIIRALKRDGVPVSGADRLKLSEHGVFADLVALGRFARFPGDDLSLAALLRGPFCDVDEADLFDLAHGREGSLWSTLGRRAGERTAWAEAAEVLGWARRAAERDAPFDFYGRFLGRLDSAGRSMRQRLLTRLGAEGEEALDAFRAQTLGAERRGRRDMESFVAAVAASEIEIKREAEAVRAGPGEVRVMTVHGAKGLEAPIVILPDTTTRVAAQGAPLLETEDGGFLWAPRKDDDCPPSAAARDAREKAAQQESARLLYVALTRARDRLIVCGVESQKHRFEGSWYDFVGRAFDETASHAFILDGGGEGRRHGLDPIPSHAEPPAAAPASPLPAWTRGLAPAEPAAARLASPSSLGEAVAGPAPSPLAAVGGVGRYRRGELIHRLLQILPDLDPGQRAGAAQRLIARERGLTEDQRLEMSGAALGVLADPRFAAVFGPGSRAEAALAGTAALLPPGLAVSGRVDRLLVEPERVLVVDFKTNRPAPARIEDADGAYVSQMAVYWAVLGAIYPGRRIEAALVWTDGPALMPVPEVMMRAALAALAPSPPDQDLHVA
jgi:ATP-dependent helicase/nuclease subunit A